MNRGLAPWLVGAAAFAGGCGRTVPVGGVLLTLNADATLENVALTSLDLDVRSTVDGGKTFRSHSYPIADYPLPASLVIESDGDPTASVIVSASVWQGPLAIDTREYRVEKIPTDYFAPLRILFSANCSALVETEGDAAVSACPAGETCDPSHAPAGCTSNVVVAGNEAGAGPSNASPDADDADDAGEALDAASPTDATLGDDGSTGSPDSGDSCDAGDPRCAATLPCRTACVEATYCFKGQCVPVPPSCLGTDNEACTSYEVPGGPFYRSYDGAGYLDRSAPANISGLRIDAYEVSVGRFANFVNAVILGVGLPDGGTGKHGHLNGGLGLASVGDAGDGGSYETGWDPAWNAGIATTRADWDSNLSGFSTSTWYPENPSINANLPINTVTWYEAYAFCIWDDGFLPSEAEWNYAAAGGSEQRVYPWGSMDPGTNSAYAIYDCYYGGSGPGSCGGGWGNIGPLVGRATMGNGKFGQSDLAGNMWEWTLDTYAPYATPCKDCIALGGTNRVFRGGSYYQVGAYLAAGSRVSDEPAKRFSGVGFRCARTP